ncbi:hypothetical protein ACJJTC_015102 [Scirpophaga incertulas]
MWRIGPAELRSVNGGEFEEWMRAADLSIIAPSPPSQLFLQLFLDAINNPPEGRFIGGKRLKFFEAVEYLTEDNDVDQVNVFLDPPGDGQHYEGDSGDKDCSKIVTYTDTSKCTTGWMRLN